jgi:hypothetical protein
MAETKRYVKLDKTTGKAPDAEWEAAQPPTVTGVGTHLTMGAFSVTLGDGSKLNLALRKNADGKFLVEFDPK